MDAGSGPCRWSREKIFDGWRGHGGMGWVVMLPCYVLIRAEMVWCGAVYGFGSRSEVKEESTCDMGRFASPFRVSDWDWTRGCNNAIKHWLCAFTYNNVKYQEHCG
jgi:hypothetical protein